MSDQIKQLGKLESVHPTSPVFLQRALVVIILSFIFFFAMLIAFTLRQHFGYFLLATAFLIVKLFTLFGWLMQRRKEVKIYENGISIGKKNHFYDELEKVSLRELNSKKNEVEILKTNGEKLIITEAIFDVKGIVKKIEKKIFADKVENKSELLATAKKL